MAWTPGTSRGFPPKERAIILQRDPTCCCTGCPEHHGPCTKPGTEADHIVQPSAGGSNHPDNGRGLCHRCHVWNTQRQAHANRPRQRRTPEQHPGLT